MFGYDQQNGAHQYDLWMHSLHTVVNLQRNMEIVRDEVIPELDQHGYELPCMDVKRLLYYVEYHDEHVSVKLKHVRRHLNMVSFEEFQYLMLLQMADAKAHIQFPIITERIKMCEKLFGYEGRELYKRMLDEE